MNYDTFKGKTYKMINFWKDEKNNLDSKNNPYPEPKQGKEWNGKEEFLLKLKNTEIDLTDNYNKYKNPKNCQLCDKKNVTLGYFYLNGYIWEDGLFHYIHVHNIKPVDEFIKKIKEFKLKVKKNILRINGNTYMMDKLKYVKIDRNQLLILDALMKHGGYKKKYIDSRNDKIFRYSEHAGLLDFNGTILEKIIVSAETIRVDKGDNEIYMPTKMPYILDYEYIFHTHPPTPKPGGRADVGVLYEFPSVSDIFHFISHYNRGETQGSLVITPEGLYNIRSTEPELDIIDINENKLYKSYNKIIRKVQNDALIKYGVQFTSEFFYSTISQNTSYIDSINVILKEFKLHIDFFPREKDNNNKWILNTVYLPIYFIESYK
jgi:hypothetical protein